MPVETSPSAGRSRQLLAGTAHASEVCQSGVDALLEEVPVQVIAACHPVLGTASRVGGEALKFLGQNPKLRGVETKSGEVIEDPVVFASPNFR